MFTNGNTSVPMKGLEDDSNAVTGCLSGICFKIGFRQIRDKKSPANQTKKLDKPSQHTNRRGKRHVWIFLTCKCLMYQEGNRNKEHSCECKCIPGGNQPRTTL